MTITVEQSSTGLSTKRASRGTKKPRGAEENTGAGANTRELVVDVTPSGLYRIKRKGGGHIPPSLDGHLFTREKLAQEALDKFLKS